GAVVRDEAQRGREVVQVGGDLPSVDLEAHEPRPGAAVRGEHGGGPAGEADQGVEAVRPVDEVVVDERVDGGDLAPADEAGEIHGVHGVVPQGGHAVGGRPAPDEVLVELGDAEGEGAPLVDPAQGLGGDVGVAALEADESLPAGGAGGGEQGL